MLTTRSYTLVEFEQSVFRVFKMNRFRSRKKSHDAGDPQKPADEAPAVPALPSSFASKTFKRNKKAPQEVKPQVNIATALPPSDDFRTSLLMPNLSARFSMLREQDDPNSKIGKANDDSVLFPKRASRLNLFNRNELMDIAEVGSSRSSGRPTMKPWGTDSYVSFDSEEDGSHGGSVMSRARPGEGNTMFGGRQKIYKIPVGGTGTSKNGNEDGDGAPSKGMGGKFLYGDDVSLSAFQKLREREREQEKEEKERATAQQNSGRSSKEHLRSNSPQQVEYNHHRETASSTTSALSELRSSTAATSVASQKSIHGGNGLLNGNSPGTPATAQAPINGTNIERPNFKSRRLYGQGLDQQLHEQQSSAMSRLETLHRQRTVGSLPLPNNNLTLSRSATNLNERFQRSSPLFASHEFQAASPPPSASPSRFADFDLSPSGDQSNPTINRMRADSGFRRTPPLSPPISPIQDPTLVAALEPNDLGKATALGAFNKPKKLYDDEQYLQRQLQLYHGRETPAPSLDEHPANRTRDNSLTSTQSRPISLKNHQDRHSNDPVLAIVPENPGPSAEDRQPDTNQPHAIRSSSHNVSPIDPSPQPISYSGQHTPPSPVSRQTSNGGLGGTNSERIARIDHPIYRMPPTDHLHTPPPDSQPLIASKNSLQETLFIQNGANDVGKPNGLDAGSPTLPTASGLTGLNETGSSHVRNESESSVYPDESPGLTSKFHLQSYHEGNPLGIERGTRRSETFFHKEAWDPGYRDSRHDGLSRPDTAERKEATPEPLAIKAHQIFSNASAMQKFGAARREEKAQHAVVEAHRTSDESSNSGSWREQLKAHGHTRGVSTETAKEQENFANELAQRRRMVRDNLQSFVENESRSASPHAAVRTHENSPSKPGAPFGILKSKSSKSSLSGRKEQPSKALKMLGISSVPNSLSGSPRSAHDSAIGDESDTYHPGGHDRKVNGRPIAPGLQSPNYFQPQRRDPYSLYQERLPQRTSPPSSKGSADVRSNLGSPERRPGSPHDRSNGRGAYPIDRENGYHREGPQYRTYSQAPRVAPELAENLPGHQIPPSSPHPALTGRSRGNSRTGSATGYYDHRRGNLALQTNSQQNLVPSGPPSSARSATFAHDVSPSLPHSTIPVMITSPPPVTAGRVQQHRKRSINKQDISDPMFISSTSSVGTVELPPGASLCNGMEKSHGGSAPPVPPFNPRRKRNLILRQALGRGDKAELSPSREHTYQDRSNVSADEREQAPRPRQRLRKTSSEGGSMNARARQQILLATSPAMPHFPEHSVAAAPSSNVASFTAHPGVQRCPNEPSQTVPASAIMF